MEEHPADSAPRAIKSGKCINRAGNTKTRQIMNNSINKAYSQENDCRLYNFYKSLFHQKPFLALSVSCVKIESLVDAVLHKSVSSDSKYETEDKVKNSVAC